MKLLELCKYCESIDVDCEICEYMEECDNLSNGLESESPYSLKKMFDDDIEL